MVEVLTQTRKSLTLRSLLFTGFPHDPEFFAAGLALAREWSRQGLKVALVDLDFRHPTVVRPKPHPNEGFVDALDYGCSFRRVAWELVSDALWLVGPGSHPPDEDRFAEHPDWDRVTRVFSTRVDVTLYLAPFLDRKGFTGRLSKRMDGVLLAAAVERAGRSALRDAFLELWGSDAPMIGCVGIAVADARFVKAGRPLEPDPVAGSPGPDPVEGSASSALATPGGAPADPPRPISAGPTEEPGAADALVATIGEEVKRGAFPRVRPRPRRKRVMLAALAACVIAGVGIAAAVAIRHRAELASFVRETLPAGTERVLPAQAGGPGPRGVPDMGRDGESKSAAGSGEDAGTPPAGRDASGGASASGTAPTPGSTSTGALPYRVHVASFRSEAKVRELVQVLRARGLDAWYAPAEEPTGWYRVFIGHFATHAQAAERAKWLLDTGWVDRAMPFPDTER